MSNNTQHKAISQKSLYFIQTIIAESWQKIAPFWPLKHLVAVNPLQGFQDLTFESALSLGAAFFQQPDCPDPIHRINRLTIQWMQAFFDQGQALIPMPLRSFGLYKSWKKLACFNAQIHQDDWNKKQWISELPESSEWAIEICLNRLNIPESEQGLFLTLLLTTLPGWASHVQYCTQWAENEQRYPISSADYLAVRIILATLLWPNARCLLEWHKQAISRSNQTIPCIPSIEAAEKEYIEPLLQGWHSPSICPPLSKITAQLIFCIDVRSEPFRAALEKQGAYETFGFSGFFGVPVRIHNTSTNECYASCPVFLKPHHTVHESPCPPFPCSKDLENYARLNGWKSVYHAVKYNMFSGFLSLPGLGLISGFWMAFRTFLPIRAMAWREYWIKKIRPAVCTTPEIKDIPFSDQCTYAQSALETIGLTKNFAPLIVFCGHGSTTQNNAYATILDCGACGGHHGGHNAKIISKILNSKPIRQALHKNGIVIPDSTLFLAAEHNTTSDAVEIDDHPMEELASWKTQIEQLKIDLMHAGKSNSHRRSQILGFQGTESQSAKHVKIRSLDWAQIHPECGLSGNASIIIAPRQQTKHMDLGGRAFLHSYDYLQDPDGSILTRILTAPMIVTQWINSQYLFSTLDNVAYGAGSKVTKNVTGKIGIMQGNASDLMTGLPLQSVYKTDKKVYQKPVRLTAIVYAPHTMLDTIISLHSTLQKLFKNGWVLLVCIEPNQPDKPLFLNRDLTWRMPRG